MKNLKLLLFLLFIFIVSNASANQPIMVSGNIKNTSNEVLRDFKFSFTDQSGKSISSKTDSEGNFSLVLYSGNIYTLEAKGLMANNEGIDLTSNTSYTEITKNYVLTQIKPNLELHTFDMFKHNSATINIDEDIFKEILTFIKTHKIKKVKFTINSGDTYLLKKGRKKKLNKLLEDRKKSLQMALFGINFSEKNYEIETIYSELTNKKKIQPIESKVIISEM